MNVLVACEESQAVCKAFREKGHEAYSCDIIECSGGHPEWHIMQDVLPLLNGNCEFETVDGTKHKIDGKWDLLIAHPPCTYLTSASTRVFSLRVTPAEKVVDKWRERAKAAIFFMRFAAADCNHICIENPVGFMNTVYRKADQIIHPYYFVDNERHEDYHTKRTCLWLKNLEPLKRTVFLPPPKEIYISQGKCPKKITWVEAVRGKNRSTIRSKTATSIAKAMAEQWG